MLKLKLATKFNANINPSTKLITLPPGFNCDASLDHEGWPKRNKVSNHIFHMTGVQDANTAPHQLRLSKYNRTQFLMTDPAHLVAQQET